MDKFQPDINHSRHQSQRLNNTESSGETLEISGNKFEVSPAKPGFRNKIRALIKKDAGTKGLRGPSTNSSKNPASRSIRDHNIKTNPLFNERQLPGQLKFLPQSKNMLHMHSHEAIHQNGLMPHSDDTDDLESDLELFKEQQPVQDEAMGYSVVEDTVVDRETGEKVQQQMSTSEAAKDSEPTETKTEQNQLRPTKETKLKGKSDWKITKGLSTFSSTIINRKHGLSDCAQKVSEAIKQRDQVSFRTALHGLIESTKLHNTQNPSNIITYHEQLDHLHVNGKPLLYALAESDYPEFIQMLCQDEALKLMKPRAFYALSVFKDRSRDEYITDHLHIGELNRSGWWCYPESPVCFALSSGNIDTAITFIENGGSIKGSETILKTLPAEDLEKISSALSKQQSNIKKEIESSEKEVAQLEKDPNQKDKYNQSRLRITAIAVQGQQNLEDISLLNTEINQDR
ncbi:hypothetical protein [Endozoicomonas elysicola]|uniref:hypothetical protein n=1 Tax=Endozoicomonas elysicola TaxID=305900 RepID=UPI0003A596F4|nr:hypothetical protein [Endozoicomonas elysicola]